MRPGWGVPVSRRRLLGRGLPAVGGLAAGLRLGRAPAQELLLTASGGGVNLKRMPGPDGDGEVPLRELFGFDAHYAQCVIEDNLDAFAMDTFEMGRVVIAPHAFFMAVYANAVSLVGIRQDDQGRRVANLTGELSSITEAGTASGRVGSREVEEPAVFEIEAVDGGHGGGAAGDRFAFTVFFDPEQAPIHHAIFGPNPTFTGELVAGEVTIAAPASCRCCLPGRPRRGRRRRSRATDRARARGPRGPGPSSRHRDPAATRRRSIGATRPAEAFFNGLGASRTRPPPAWRIPSGGRGSR